MCSTSDVLYEVVIHIVLAFVAWAFQRVGFGFGKREVCGTQFHREPSQGVRMGHVAALTTEPSQTANFPHTSQPCPPVSLGSWGSPHS